MTTGKDQRTMRAIAAVLVFTFVLASSLVRAEVALCPGDSWAVRGASTILNTEVSIFIRAKSRISHASSHDKCAEGASPKVGAQAKLKTGLFSTCSAERFDVSHLSEADSYKICGPLSEGYYATRGSHYYNLKLAATSTGNQVLIEAAPLCKPCTPGYVDYVDCPPIEQDGCRCCPDPTPLVIDRSGDGLQFSNAEDGALFDINGHGAMFWLGWPTSADDAWLALDRNEDGTIDDGSELFGNTRNLASGVNAQHGYEVLAELDENFDGVVNAQPLFAKLLLWGDANRNGVSEPSELTSLTAAGIEELSLNYGESGRRDRWGNRFRFTAPIEPGKNSVDVFPVWSKP